MNMSTDQTRIYMCQISFRPTKYTKVLLTQLYITDPYALYRLLKDFLKVNTCKATGDAGHHNGHQTHKLRVCSQDLFLRIVPNL